MGFHSYAWFVIQLLLNYHGYDSLFVSRKTDENQSCVFSGFSRDVYETCVRLECYAARIGNLSPMFWHKLSVPSSRVRVKGENCLTLEVGTDSP